MRNAYKIPAEKMEERDHMGKLGTDGWIILK
jgi:hypothetical protein